MAIQCLECNYTLPGVNSLHLVAKCPKCGNTKRDRFFRVDDEDIDPVAHARDKEWLQAHRREE